MMCFEHEDVTYVHAPKIGSRSILGWLAILKNPKLYEDHPEYFKEINVGDAVYKGIRSRVDATNSITTPIAFCVTRDPIKRFVSNYKNRVLTHQKVKPTPTLSEFMDNFDDLFDKNTDIRNHFPTLTHFYGPDRSVYQKVFRTENLDECRVFLQEHFKCELPSLRLQQSKKVKEPQLTDQQVSWIKDKYSEDYVNGWI